MAVDYGALLEECINDQREVVARFSKLAKETNTVPIAGHLPLERWNRCLVDATDKLVSLVTVHRALKDN